MEQYQLQQLQEAVGSKQGLINSKQCLAGEGPVRVVSYAEFWEKVQRAWRLSPRKLGLRM